MCGCMLAKHWCQCSAHFIRTCCLHASFDHDGTSVTAEGSAADLTASLRHICLATHRLTACSCCKALWVLCWTDGHWLPSRIERYCRQIAKFARMIASKPAALDKHGIHGREVHILFKLKLEHARLHSCNL